MEKTQTPKKSRNFPNFLDGFLAYSKEQESTNLIRTWTCVSVVAAALERKVWINQIEPVFPNLYVFIIAESATVRKSTSTRTGVNLLRAIPGFRIMSDKITDAAMILNLQQTISKFEINGVSYFQSPTFIYASELADFLNESTYGEVEVTLTKLYDTENAYTKETAKDGRIVIKNQCVNMLGASTKEWLIRSIPPDQIKGGFTSRIIFVVENSKPDILVPWPMRTPEITELERKLISDLTVINSLMGEIRMEETANKMFTDWYMGDREVAEKADPKFSSYYGRKGTTVKKLGIILSVMESNDLVVCPRHIEKAVALLKDLEKTMFDVFSIMGKNRYSKEFDDIIKYFKRHKRVTFGQYIQMFRKDLDMRTMTEIINMLTKSKEIRCVSSGTEDIIEYVGSRADND